MVFAILEASPAVKTQLFGFSCFNLGLGWRGGKTPTLYLF